MTLNQLKAGECGIITKVDGEGELRCRLLDMGVTPKTTVNVIKFAPMGDPIEITVRGYALTLRLDQAKTISVTRIGEEKPKKKSKKNTAKQKEKQGETK